MTEISKLTETNFSADFGKKFDNIKKSPDKEIDIWDKSGATNKTDSKDSIYKTPELKVPNESPWRGIYMPVADDTPKTDYLGILHMPEEDYTKF